MGDILAFPRRSTTYAIRAPHGGDADPDSHAIEDSISVAAQSPTKKALLFGLTSLEIALASLAGNIRRLPESEGRERLLKQQASLVAMIRVAEQLLAECEA